MCGIFGIFIGKNSPVPAGFVRKSVRMLTRSSESRGKDSSGFAIRSEGRGEISILKGPVPVSRLLKNRAFIERLDAELADFGPRVSRSGPFALFGHARLVTNGSQLEERNNQPVVKDGIVGIHNGIIVNAEELWSKHPSLRRIYDIDTEILLSAVRLRLLNGESVEAAVSQSIEEITGTVSTALFFEDRDQFVLATNNGSLYVLTDDEDIFIFSSERYALSGLAHGMVNRGTTKAASIRQVAPRTGLTLNFKDFTVRPFAFSDPDRTAASGAGTRVPYRIDVRSVGDDAPGGNLLVDMGSLRVHPKAAGEIRLLEYNDREIGGLRRCAKCILPETFPFIRFDETGTCNYCGNYRLKNQPKPLQAFIDMVAPYRSGNEEPDCIIPLSGGRDSTFTLHMAKNVLGLNPMAFTYDWGMVTDLARRNIARVCGKLAVENIIVAADIRKKRKYINRNIAAWLKKPDLGLVPLFMAGDKYFFHYTAQLRRQTGIRLNIWGINPLENTEFKVGFCGVRPDFEKKTIYSLNLPGKMKVAAFYGANFLLNPRYLNSSIADTMGSFVSRYSFPQEQYFHLFDHVQWNENEIESVITGEYDWERSPDTHSTWRIGDGTAGFYNYIYYTVAGFSEIDTFRSNQIREGMLTREKALEMSVDENQPRYETIKWYLEIIGLDFEDTIRTVNRIPKRYR
jgi:glutamine---fructose-6-phosphate transaminase (isomerizing)